MILATIFTSSAFSSRIGVVRWRQDFGVAQDAKPHPCLLQFPENDLRLGHTIAPARAVVRLLAVRPGAYETTVR